MASTYTSELRIEKIGTGEQTGTWGTTTNTQYDLFESAISGTAAVTHDDSASYSLTTSNGADDAARHMFLAVGGTLTAARNLVCPSTSKLYFIYNNTSGGFSVTLKTSGGTGIEVTNGDRRMLYCDGVNVVDPNPETVVTPGASVGLVLALGG